jgi:hypothetical protein
MSSKSIVRSVVLALSLVAVGAGAASAQSLKPYVLKKSDAIGSYKPSGVGKVYVARLNNKICHATYNPSPSSPGMTFGATKQCAASPDAAVGSSCSCPVAIEGRPGTAYGSVFESSPNAKGPVVH